MKANPKSGSWVEDAKKRAALEAVKHIRNGYALGLGSGTTAAYAIGEIGKVIRQNNWHITAVPTSYQAFLLAVECGIPVTSLDERPKLDLNIDGADQIDRDLNMIKGMGGALTREKIVASASKLNVVVADESKLVRKLGVNHPVPVEVLPFAVATVCSKIHGIGGKPVLRVGNGKVGPVVTDNGNFIVDVYVRSINNPNELDSKLKSIPGVIETGLFVGIADIAYVGTRNSVEKISRK